MLLRTIRIRKKLYLTLKVTILEVDNMSHQHMGHTAMRRSFDKETYFNVKMVSSKFKGQSLVKRHHFMNDLLPDEI